MARTARLLAAAVLVGELAVNAALAAPPALPAGHDLRCEADAGNGHPLLPSTGDHLPVGRTPCPGVRPGARVYVERPDGGYSGCTLNFLFTHTDEDGAVTRFVGTAGHCGDRPRGTWTWEFGRGPRAEAVTTESPRVVIGHVVYAISTTRDDFALIQLFDDVETHDRMCHWGGPTGVYTDTPRSLTEPIALRHYGHGFLVSFVAPARTAFATDLRDPDYALVTGAAASGDSGSPVIVEDGDALGVIVSLSNARGGSSEEPADPGIVRVVRLPRQQELAETALGIHLDLSTGPLGR